MANLRNTKKLARFDMAELDEMANDPGMKGMLSFLEMPPQEKKRLISLRTRRGLTMQNTDYKPVPVEAAKEIAEQFQKSIVIVFAFDPVHGLTHTTTYGTTPQNKAWAAQGGEIASTALGCALEKRKDFTDYRLAQALKLLAALKPFAAAWLACKTVVPGQEAWDRAVETVAEAEKFLGPV